MKKTIIAIAAAIVMSATAMAQEQKDCKEGKRPNKTEMTKKRTERMVKQYGLNADQAKQLQALNEKYAGKIGPRHHGRGHHPRLDSLKGKRHELDKNGQMARRDGLRPPKDMKGKHPERPQQREAMQAYETELQQIMTADQYKAYKADMEKRFKKGRRGHKGQPAGDAND